MMTAIRLEFFKTKRRKLWLTLLAFIGLELAWIYVAFRNPSATDMAIGWMELLYQVPSLNSILFPILAAVMASRLADLEHKRDTWKLLGTMQSPSMLFLSKFLCGGWYMLLSIFFVTISMLIFGYLFHYEGAPALDKYFIFFLFQLLTALEILAVQLILSSYIRNQMIPFCVGCGGAFLGLFLLFVPVKILQYVLPWGHASLLFLVYLVDWNPDTRIMHLAYVPINFIAIAVAIGELIMLLLLGSSLLNKREV